MRDNSTQFTSEEFCRFTKAKGIKHTFVALYYPQSNGHAGPFFKCFINKGQNY